MASAKSNAANVSKSNPVTPADIVASMKAKVDEHTKVYSSGDTSAITKAANKVKVISADLVTLERVLKRFNEGYYN